jgi:uncharacterized protein with FMN-binding domain
MRKIGLPVLVLGLALFTGCSRAEVQAVRNLPIGHIDLSQVKDGAFSGEYAYAGFTYEVRVTVAAHKITDIALVKNRTTRQAKMAAGVATRVLDQQRNDVDAVSGATTTSKALLKAIENALNKGL